MNQNLSELAKYLQDEQQVIIAAWESLCQSDAELEVVSRLSREKFRNNIPAALEGLYQIFKGELVEPSSESLTAEIAKHGHHRWKQGFNLRQLIRDWGHFNRALIKKINDFFEQNSEFEAAAHTEALDQLASFITEAQSSSVRRFDQLRQAEAQSLTKDLTLAKEKFEELTEARGQMLRQATHDIRGGLSAIAGASAVLKLSAEPNESFGELLDVLDQGVDSVREMLNSLLDLSRLESGVDTPNLVTVNVAEVLEQLVVEHQAAAWEKELRLESEGPSDLLVRTDPQMVARIAQNLVVNAVQHTCEGEICVSWEVQDNYWELRVADTGPGIQELVGSPMAQELDSPDFDRGSGSYRTSRARQGEGIGLSIVKRLCDLLDAGVSLESEIGQGTTFRVQFPLEYDGKKN